MWHKNLRLLLLIVSFVATVCGRADAATCEPVQPILFLDQFTAHTLSSYWQTSAPAQLGGFSYVAPSKPAFSKIGYYTVLNLSNTLNNLQYTGYVGSSTYNLNNFKIDVRFNTGTQARNVSIDGFIVLSIIDVANNKNFGIFGPFAGNFADSENQALIFGVSGIKNEQKFPLADSISSAFLGHTAQSNLVFSNNTWYHLILEGSKTRPVTAELLNDDGSIKFAAGLGFTLADLPNGFKIGLFQLMGTPGSPSGTAVAVDYVRLTGS